MKWQRKRKPPHLKDVLCLTGISKGLHFPVVGFWDRKLDRWYIQSYGMKELKSHEILAWTPIVRPRWCKEINWEKEFKKIVRPKT